MHTHPSADASVTYVDASITPSVWMYVCTYILYVLLHLLVYVHTHNVLTKCRASKDKSLDLFRARSAALLQLASNREKSRHQALAMIAAAKQQDSNLKD